MNVSPVLTTLTSAPNPSTYGQPVELTATVSAAGSGQPTPTGTVTFLDGASPVGSGVDLDGGTATLPISTLTAGTHSITAVYSGDSNYPGATSSLPLTQTVTKATPTVYVTDAGGTYNGTPFPATATVAGVIAGVDNTPSPSLEGVSPTLTYYDANGNPLSGAPSAVGTYTVVATFPGSADYTSASSSTSAPTTFVIAPNTPPPPPPPPALPQIVLNTAMTTDAADVALNYTISQANVTQLLAFNVYQSDQGSVDGSSVLLGQTTLPGSDTADLGQGSHTINLALVTPIAVNPTMPYIVVVANPDGSVQEASGSVNTVSAINLSPLELQADGGFTLNTQTNQYTASGTIRIGMLPAAGQSFQPFLQLSGSASYNDKTIQFEGTVSADIGSVAVELFQGSWTINVGQSSTNSIQLTAGSQSLTLGGLAVTVTSLTLTQQGITLQGSVSLATVASGNAGPFAFAANGPLTMSVNGNNSILISQAGISISGGQLQVPDTTLTYKNISFATNGLTALYVAATAQQADSFTIQGTATLSSPFGTLQANFAAPNSIVITNGQASFAGRIRISNVPPFPGGWALNNAFIDLNTVNNTLTTSGSLHVPIGSGFDLNATFGFFQGQLNSVMVGAVNMNQEIGATPIFLQSITGMVENLANAGSQPITIMGSVVLTEGPIVSIPLPSWLGGPISGSVMQLVVTGTLTADEVSGTATLTVVGGLLANGQVSLDLNEDTGAFSETGSLSLLDGLVSTSAQIVGDASGDITLSGQASVTLPGFSLLRFSFPATQLAGGTISLQYNPLSPPTSDFVIATGTDNLFGTGSYGLKVDFAGNVTQFDPVTTTSVLQSALASDSTPTFQVSTDTDLQTLISAVNGLSAPATPATITVNLSGGPFSDVTVNPPAGVTVVLTGNGLTTTIVGHSPALTVSSGTVLVTGVILTTDTDSPNILVTGGALVLRDDTIEGSIGGTDPAIAITGGTLDLGTATDPGGNTLNVNGTGEFLQDATLSPVPDDGNVLEVNGTPLSAPYLSLMTLGSSLASSVFGQPVTFTASILAANPADGSPTGNVAFIDTTTGTALGSAPITNGSATLISSSLSVGTHTITANYQGDINFAFSLSSTTATVQQDNSTTTVSSSTSTSSFGQTVTLTAKVTANAPGSGTPTGTADFYDTTTNTDLTPGNVAISSGTATFSTASLSIGSNSIKVSYLGDGNFFASSASAGPIIVNQSIIVLDPTAGGALTLSGNASIKLSGGVFVDSSSSSAISATGNAQVNASIIDVHGGVQKSGNASLSPVPATGAAPVPDPLTSLALPSTSGLASDGSESVSGNSSATIQPGIYSQITVSGNAKLTLSCGTYILEGGGFSVSGSASISGSGVMIVNAGSMYPTAGGTYGSITLSGNGTYSLSPLTTGAYAGIVIFQSRDNTKPLTITGNASGMTGKVYAPAAQLAESGNAQLNAAVVVDTLTVSGNGVANIVTLHVRAGTLTNTPAPIRPASTMNNLNALAVDLPTPPDAYDGASPTFIDLEALTDVAISLIDSKGGRGLFPRGFA